MPDVRTSPHLVQDVNQMLWGNVAIGANAMRIQHPSHGAHCHAIYLTENLELTLPHLDLT